MRQRIKIGCAFRQPLRHLLIIILFLLLSATQLYPQSDTTPLLSYESAERDTPVYMDEDVIVKSNRIPLGILEIPSSASTRKLTETEKGSLFSIGRLTGHTPGFRVYTPGNIWGRTCVDVRGFYGGSQADHILVTFEGIPINNISSGLAAWQDFDLACLGRMETIKGPVSAQYGDFGFGGMVALYCGSGPEDHDGRISTSYGSDNAYAFNCQVERTLSRSNIFASLSRKHNRGWREHGEFESESFLVRFESGFKDRLKFKTLLNYSHIDEDDPGALSQEEIDLNRESAARDLFGNNRVDMTNSKSIFACASLDVFIGRDDEINSKLYISSSDNEEITTITAPIYGKPDEIKIGGELSYTSRGSLWNRLLQIVNGVNIEYGRLESSFSEVTEMLSRGELITSGNGSKITLSAFTQCLYYLTPSVSLSGGLRIDRISTEYKHEDSRITHGRRSEWQDHTSLSPKFALGTVLGKNLSVYASVSGAFKSPTLMHLYNSPPIYYFQPPDHDDYFIISNSSLKPQTGACCEIGAKYIDDPKLNVALTYYNYMIKNEIDFDPSSYSYKNIGKSQHKGIEFAVEARTLPGLGLNANVSYNSSEFRNGEYARNQINGVPKYKYYANLYFQKNKFGFISIDIDGRGTQYIDQANRQKLDAYRIMSLSATKYLRTFDLTARIENIFDKHYINDGYIGLMGESRFYPASGRSFIITLVFKF
jgi:outer membrane receptor protein involved in Fe transport